VGRGRTRSDKGQFNFAPKAFGSRGCEGRVVEVVDNLDFPPQSEVDFVEPAGRRARIEFPTEPNVETVALQHQTLNLICGRIPRSSQMLWK
jgi:hypothetical protein